MAIIEINQLVKTYRVYQKKEGLREAIRGLWHREHKDVDAVRDVSQLNQESSSLFWARMVREKPRPSSCSRVSFTRQAGQQP
jgi:hypothetical protein